jgi:Skp family chaperone for outer membrane proteins
VKKIWVLLAGVAVLAVGVYVASPGRAQQQQPYTAATTAGGPRTRIALVDVLAVLRNYDKMKNARANLKREIENTDATLKAKKQAILDRQTQIQAQAQTLNQDQKNQLTHELRTMERDLEDQAADAKQRIQKEEIDIMAQVYREVQDTVKAYAINAELDVVLQYGDLSPAEATNPAAIAQRSRIPGCMPLFINTGMDITAAITNIMNRNLQTGAAVTPPAGAH